MKSVDIDDTLELPPIYPKINISNIQINLLKAWRKKPLFFLLMLRLKQESSSRNSDSL
jgi:hypothetical protein